MDRDLFIERLEAFCTSSVRTFAARENRSFDETHQLVAEYYSRSLFSSEHSTSQDRAVQIKTILSDTSRMLESLGSTVGVESFVLAVDPSDDSQPSFLGGTTVGKEYWRGLRGGGDAGAKAFKSHCVKTQSHNPSSAAAAKSNPTNARTVKSDLYEAVRKALRTASGVSNAEMKWTNPSLLNIYGVRLVGWPPSIPSQNPSSLKADQNKQLLEAVEKGTLHFVRTILTNEGEPAPPAEEQSNFEWAIEYDDPSMSPNDEDRPGPAKRARPDS
ncbi:hypothetical protein MIND_00237300 [Mycena indigotica]|uniref:Uncharacterized protein n=1 Tax=Mycena indigotica TaxID=2126181 RepID=A0A8H6WEV5_9AGAR|nr:uncharacterized protein MIND_00237300 [Mycena indigotica]KAF7312243.1 hypothetical protein MIND_00237300 [Mycena indigotica]